MRAAVYARLSRNRNEDQSESTKSQVEECRALASERKWTVEMIEVDDDSSAYSGKRRPGYERILDAMRGGAIDAVVAWHPDRLHRAPIELESFIDLVVESGVEVATVQSGRVDLSTPAGRMNARMLGTVARYESEHRSERIRLAHARIAASGRWAGGTVPFGFRADRNSPGGLVLDPEQAARVVGWVGSLLAGATLADIVNALNAEGYPTPRNSRWTIPTVRAIVTSDRIAGYRVHKGSVLKAEWPQIVAMDEVEAVRRVLRQRGGRRTPELWREYLLSGGLATCGRCGSNLHSRRRGNGAPVYHCEKSHGGCGSLSIAAESFENAVAEVAFGACHDLALPQPDAAAPVDVAAIDAKMAEWAAWFASDEVSRPEWDAARTVLNEQRAEAVRTSVVDALKSYRNSPNALEEAWPSLSVASRRAVLDALFERIEVQPATTRGRTFDVDRISYTWR